MAQIKVKAVGLVDKKDFKREISRLASLANKRLVRLENKGLTDSPAYQKWVENGAAKFSVKGKDFNQLQSELARINRFINSQTSTIRGMNSVLKNIAANTGMKYKNLEEIRQQSEKFFELASKVEQYLRTVDDIASAIGYQKIWEVINTYIQENEIDLANSEKTIDELTADVSFLIKNNATDEVDQSGNEKWLLMDF